MKKLFPVFATMMVISLSISAQEYRTAVGGRFGTSNGLTLKHFIASDVAIEGILTARYNGYNVTGLYEIHTEPFRVNNLYFFYGFGGHFGSWETVRGKPWWDDTDTHNVIGIDGIIGLEYNFGKVPFSMAIDWKPGFNIIGYPKFWSDELSLSIRYAWGSR